MFSACLPALKTPFVLGEHQDILVMVLVKSLTGNILELKSSVLWTDKAEKPVGQEKKCASHRVFCRFEVVIVETGKWNRSLKGVFAAFIAYVLKH